MESEESAKIGTAVEHSRNNKYFCEFVEEQKKLVEKNPDALNGLDLEDDGLFLAYMTRRYFKDNIWANILKIIAGIVCLVISRFLISHGFSTHVKFLPIAIFAFGVILIPLGIIMTISYFSCYKNYGDYVTGRDDPFMDKVIKFYTDSRKK